MTDENETKEIVTTQMQMTPQQSATIDPSDASPEGLALMRQRVNTQREMIKVAMSLTSPDQWTVFSGNGKESIYPTGGAADTILRRAFGLTWGPKEVTVEEGKNGPVAVCRSWLRQGDRDIEEFEGRRSMGGFVKNESDLRKGAIENMKSVAVRDLLGLRFRSPSELREMGLDVGRLTRRAEFRDTTTEDSRPDDGSPIVPFGKNKGKAITELEDKSLAWYVDAARKSVDDPSKEKWKAKEQKWLDVLLAEQAKRSGGQSEAKPPPPKDPYDYGPPPMEPGANG
jgi:hypothetical protein